ncbi:MAG: c-type cytochrome [Ignavibacteriales bacterium]|jgi:cytochrome c oxidase cbb3-type subunit 3|nr:cbb3-type cytochrome c oxidase N-terminal domain-containing protein [Ignavibacteriaceae bacterium]NLH62048.1 c-type cytochrome [Ignavibacteriales bacterium]HOJ17692.1 cbb3-type cytochrome c oxidase N-terminal domain-containing protein [Ignavibacteriaceae bacterium]HPO55609.1 cbb3-type cytochrome c oxidase N-terminal domain-containing protein [Ignavibacteriaceae bacterium]
MEKLTKPKMIIMLLISIITTGYAQKVDSEFSGYIETSFIILLLLIAVTGVLFLLESQSEGRSILNLMPQLLWLKDRLTDAKPVEKEKDILLDHDYDGILELDNNLPPWWKALFYVTIVWGAIYLLWFHVFQVGNLQDAEYTEEVRIAEIEKAALLGPGAIDENNVTKLTDPIALSTGKETFLKHCAACHGRGGEGLVGPNLTDDYWIHGADIKQVFLIVKNGVPEKGMISWKSQLNPVAMQEVSSYILSLRGSNPPNQKPPEGVMVNFN